MTRFNVGDLVVPIHGIEHDGFYGIGCKVISIRELARGTHYTVDNNHGQQTEFPEEDLMSTDEFRILWIKYNVPKDRIMFVER